MATECPATQPSTSLQSSPTPEDDGSQPTATAAVTADDVTTDKGHLSGSLAEPTASTTQSRDVTEEPDVDEEDPGRGQSWPPDVSDRGWGDDCINDHHTATGSLADGQQEDDGMGVTGEEEEEEQSRLLINSEMLRNHVQQPERSSSGGSEAGPEAEGRVLVEKPVQRPVLTCAVLCVAFFFVYTANLAIQNLQSSLHQTEGLGITSLAVLYGSIIVFGTLSPLVIRFLTAKRTLVVAFIAHLLYTVSNFYPTFPTLLTSSLLLGVLAGPMWTAQGLYCTATGLAYAGLHQMEEHGALSMFNGVFFAFYEATQISGNLIASLVLTRGSYNDTQDHNKVCGAALCPGTSLNSTTIEQPEKMVVYVLMSIYLVCNVVGLLLTVFVLPPLPRDQEIRTGEVSIKKSTTSCLSMLLVPKMLLLMPFFMAQAMNSGILLAEYNEKFVSCSVGIQWVGYVMTVFGVLTSALAVSINYAAKLVGRRLLFSSAAMADISVNVVMLLWNPSGTKIVYLFILPCVSGFAEGIFQAQFNSLVAMVFPDQVTGAFATYHTSKATAFTLTFVLARFLCLNQRLYLSLCLSILGLLGYCIVEVMLHLSKKRQSTDSDGDPKLVTMMTVQGQ